MSTEKSPVQVSTIAAAVVLAALVLSLGYHAWSCTQFGCEAPWRWWYGLDQTAAAAWVLAAGTILSIGLVALILSRQYDEQRRTHAAEQRDASVALAAELEFALKYLDTVLEWTPGSQNDAAHSLTMGDAHSFMRFQSEELQLLRGAVQRAYLFGWPVTDRVVQFGLAVGSFNHIGDDLVRHCPNLTAAEFYEAMESHVNALRMQIEDIRGLMRPFGPQPG
jgi:hypothetical protein